MIKKSVKSAQNKLIGVFLIPSLIFITIPRAMCSELIAAKQVPDIHNKTCLSPSLEICSEIITNIFSQQNSMKQAMQGISKITEVEEKLLQSWIDKGDLIILPEGELIEGQDANVIGRAENLLLTPVEKAKIQQKGIFIYDIDKTLARRDRVLLEQTIQTIESLMRNGHLVVIITGQPIDIQRDRIITPIDANLRRNLVVITNEGTVVHHFLPGGKEYLVMNNFTQQFVFTPEQAEVMENVFDGFMQENGFEYADGGEFDAREMAQAAIKLQASLQTREKYAKHLEAKLKENNITGFRGWASGSSTISFLHEKANKRDAGLEFLKQQGFAMRNAVYHGDEFFYNGNDAFIMGDPDINITVVGRLETEPFEIIVAGKPKKISLKERDKVLYLGGGPYATTEFAQNFIQAEKKYGHLGFQTIIEQIAAKNINIEAIINKISKTKQLPEKDILEELLNNWITPNNLIYNTIQQWLALSADQKNVTILERIDVEKLQDLKILCEEYRIGPQAIALLYKTIFGQSLQDDFNAVVALAAEKLYGAKPIKYAPGEDTYKLRGVLTGFADLFTVMLGEKIGSKFKDSVEKLTAQDQVFRYSEDKRELALAAVREKIQKTQKALNFFFEEEGIFSWLLAAFGNRLRVFHNHYEFEDLYTPVHDVLDEKLTDEDAEITQGLVGLSGGGGAQIMSEIMLKAEVHRLLLPIAKKMPFIMIVPAEDDGGSTAIILYDGEEVYRFKLPAMGDSMNAYAGLSRGELNDFGDPKFPYFYDVTRMRFAQEGNDPLLLEFAQLAFEQMQGLMYKKAKPDEIKKVVTFFRSLHNVLKDFTLMPIEGQSMGNIIWTATTDRKAEIDKHKSAFSVTQKTKLVPLKKLQDKQLVEIQRFLARIYGLENMLVIPSNLSPGTLFVMLDKLVIQEGKQKPVLVDNLGLDQGTQAMSAGRMFWLKEKIENVIDEESGVTYLDYEIKEGEELIVSHQNKEIPLAGQIIFRTRLRKEQGNIFAQHNIGSEPWGQEHVLGEIPEVIGIPSEAIKEKTPNQHKWGARVCTVKSGGKLRIYLDRVGAGTTLRFQEEPDKPVMFKGRVVVKQTNITESYHLSKFVKLGFTGTEKPKSVEFILKALRESQVGCVIGPGSIGTSLLPILMLDEIREELRNMARRGLPVIFMMNPVKDNETAYETINSLMQMIEDSCGEPVFGIARGGFITDMFVNDASDLPDFVRELTDLTNSKNTRLRDAERPRGVLYFQAGEREQLQKKLGKDFAIHTADVLSVINKEVRGGAPEKGVGYEPALVGQLLERIVLGRMRNAVTKLDIFKDALAIFNGQEDILNAAITYLRRKEKMWSEVNALQRIQSAFRAKREFTKELLHKTAPEVIVLNLAHNILQDSENGYVFSPQMRDAMATYLEAGGKIIISTGLPFEEVRTHIFGGINRIPEQLADNVYTITLSGSEVHRGFRMLDEQGIIIPLEALSIVERVIDMYGLPKREVLKNFGTFISLRLHKFNKLSAEEVSAINARLKENTDEDRTFFKIQWVLGAFADKYDLRDIIIKNLQRLFNEAGINWDIEAQGKASIDISHVSEVDTIKMLFERGPLIGIDEANLLFAYAGKGLTEIAPKMPNASYLSMPLKDPRSLFVQDAMIPALTKKTSEWNSDVCRALLIEAGRALRQKQGNDLSVNENIHSQNNIDFVESAI
ncbi:MAG: 2-phospho-L-lactate transferase CofD family protein [Candidatus Omnitrophota bacterium]